MRIVESESPGQGLEQRLSPSLTADQISGALGFEPGPASDPGKVTREWRFTADGVSCGIWDYKGARWSSAGPRSVFVELFGEAAVDKRIGR